MPFPCDARAIANEFLDLGDTAGVALTHMALQKLVYLGHGWLVLGEGKALVSNHFEAWKLGPVVRCLYDSLKAYGDAPVTDRVRWFNALANRVEVARTSIAQPEHEFLAEIFERYGHLDALKLSDLTHARGGPWDRVWHAPPNEIHLNQRISDDFIRKYFNIHVDSLR